MYALVFFLLSALVGGPDGLSCALTGVGDIGARGVLLSLSEDVHHFVQTVRVCRILSKCTVTSAQALLAWSRSVAIDWLYQLFVGWYLYSAATGKLSSVTPRSICGRERAADGSCITREVGNVLVSFGKSRLITMSEA